MRELFAICIAFITALHLNFATTAKGEVPPYLRPDGREFKFEREVFDVAFLAVPTGITQQQIVVVNGDKFASLLGVDDRSVSKLLLKHHPSDPDEVAFTEPFHRMATRDGKDILLGGGLGSLNLFRRNQKNDYEVVADHRFRKNGIEGLYALPKESQWLVHYSDNAVLAVDMVKGSTIKEWRPKDQIGRVAIDSEAKTIAMVDGQNVITLIRGSDLNETKRLDIEALIGKLPSSAQVDALSMSPTGNALYLVIRNGPLVSIDLQKERMIGRFDRSDSADLENWTPSAWIDVSPDGRFVATGSDSGFGLIFRGGLMQPFSLCDHESYSAFSVVHCVKWSPKGDLLATCGGNRKVILWKTEQPQK